MMRFQSIPFTARDIYICLRQRMAITKRLLLPGPFVKPNLATPMITSLPGVTRQVCRGTFQDLRHDQWYKLDQVRREECQQHV